MPNRRTMLQASVGAICGLFGLRKATSPVYGISPVQSVRSKTKIVDLKDVWNVSSYPDGCMTFTPEVGIWFVKKNGKWQQVETEWNGWKA